MSNNYKSANSEIVGREGQMYNEATETNKQIKYQHYGIFTNTNTYAVTFNPMINRPETKYIENKPVRRPPEKQHMTKGLHEPPVSMTDGQYYIHHGHIKAPPLLPPYLKKPEKLGEVQGLAYEKNKGNVIYGPKHKVIVENNIY